MAGLCLSAKAWPERSVKQVVPYSSGAMGDTVARFLAEELRPMLGQPVIVENRPGAGGDIGAAAVARAPADSYTFLVAATNNLVVNQHLYKKLDFDSLSAFDLVTFLVDVPSVLFLQPAIGKTLAEFNVQARAEKGKFNYGSPGSGTTPHLALHAIDNTLGWGMTHIPYSGAGPALTALLSNEIQAYVGGAGLALQHVQSGKLVAAAVSSEKRLTVLPETPTFAEAGLGAMKASNWWALVAPRGTPPAVVERMNSVLSEVLRRPNVQERFEKLGVQARSSNPRAMAQQLAEESSFWEKAVTAAGVSLE
jgi:tripartite-type tricarboxylate transporter receptor subunit TctC